MNTQEEDEMMIAEFRRLMACGEAEYVLGANRVEILRGFLEEIPAITTTQELAKHLRAAHDRSTR